MNGLPPKLHARGAANVLAEPNRAHGLPMAPNAAAPSFVLEIMRALQIGVSAEFEFSPFLVGAGIALGHANSERRNRGALGQTSLHRGSTFGFRGVFTAKNSSDQKVW